ncbi:unnamed protein product [Mesocestoides corti]|uniref:Uncharacterized protein n=2 Tax=Mesocestoides corti TaxID=53468 RepID=A0A0R3UR84_MESCO|nr:unnamed protein product [Mesocestoides corti]
MPFSTYFQGSGPSMRDTIAISNPTVEHCVIPASLLNLISTFDACVRAEGGGNIDEDDSDTEVSQPILKDIDFRLLRVPTPEVLCVNGSRVGRAWTGSAVPKNIFFSSL